MISDSTGLHHVSYSLWRSLNLRAPRLFLSIAAAVRCPFGFAALPALPSALSLLMFEVDLARPFSSCWHEMEVILKAACNGPPEDSACLCVNTLIKRLSSSSPGLRTLPRQLAQKYFRLNAACNIQEFASSQADPNDDNVSLLRRTGC
jgi:hypothetical protein